ncbi:MAG: helix-turn-helix domain-containing protein [Nitrososphaerales archaeon]
MISKVEKKVSMKFTPEKRIGWFHNNLRKASMLMKFFNMKNPEDEIKCPRCDEVIKEKGLYLHPKDYQKYTLHLGSLKCLIQEKYKMKVNHRKALLLYSLEGGEEEAPLCACGCGQKVSYGYHRRWNKYASRGHALKAWSSKRGRESLQRFLSLIIDGETQAEFYKRLKIRSERASYIIRRLEKLGMIRRERILKDGRWTFKLKLEREKEERG